MDAAPEAIKLCVSSREDNVFMSSFHSSPSIRIHELTSHDMAVFIDERLRFANFSYVVGVDNWRSFTEKIQEKAQGIFWHLPSRRHLALLAQDPKALDYHYVTLSYSHVPRVLSVRNAKHLTGYVQ